MLVLAVNEALPPLPRVSAKDVGEPWIQLDLVPVQILVQLLCSKHLGNPHQLVVIIVTVEKRLLPEYHGGEHAAEGPHVEAVVVHLVVHEEFWPLEVAGRDTDVVLLKIFKNPCND